MDARTGTRRGTKAFVLAMLCLAAMASSALGADGTFLKAFGKDVVTGGGTGFEKCTVLANCKNGVPGGGLAGSSRRRVGSRPMRRATSTWPNKAPRGSRSSTRRETSSSRLART